MYNIIILLEYGSVAWDPYNPIFWQYLQHRKRKHVTRLGHFRLLTICHFSLNPSSSYPSQRFCKQWVYGQVARLARKSSCPKLCHPKSELCHAKFLVKSPEILTYHAQQHPCILITHLLCLFHLIEDQRMRYSTHLSHLFCCSSRVKEGDIYYTFIPLLSPHRR